MIAFTDPNFSIFPVYKPLPKIGTTPTVEPVKTQKSFSKFVLSFLILFNKNLREFNGLM